MKAVVLHGPGDLRVDDVATPVLPPGGLIVRPIYVGICGSDVRTWRHGSPRIVGPQVPGHEFAGIVADSDVAAFPVGTPVAVCPGAPCGSCRACDAGRANLCQRRRVLGYDLPGAMAEQVAVPADWLRTNGVVALDPNRPIELGAFVEPLHTVLNGQDAARIGHGDHVLVLGLGPIGVLHIASARSRGAATSVGVDPDPGRVAIALTLLGDGHAVGMDDGWPARLRAGLDGGGFDVIIVASGAARALSTAMDLVEPGGRVLAFAGLPAGAPAFPLDLHALHYRQLSMIGAFGGTPSTFRRAAAWLATADLDVQRFAPSRFPLDEALAAFGSAERGLGLKTLLRIDDSEP